MFWIGFIVGILVTVIVIRVAWVCLLEVEEVMTDDRDGGVGP